MTGIFVGRKGTAEDAKRASDARTSLFHTRTSNVKPLLGRIDPENTMSPRAIANRLNEMNVPTVTRKGIWSSNSVRRLKAVK